MTIIRGDWRSGRPEKGILRKSSYYSLIMTLKMIRKEKYGAVWKADALIITAPPGYAWVASGDKWKLVHDELEA